MSVRLTSSVSTGSPLRVWVRAVMSASPGCRRGHRIAYVLIVFAVGAACEGATPTPNRQSPSVGRVGWNTFRDAADGLVLSYPTEWRAGESFGRFEGESGFVVIDLLSGGWRDLQAACRLVAENQFHREGDPSPRVTPLLVDGREACLIRPSPKQAIVDDTAAIVIPRHSEPQDRWHFLIVYVDSGHVRAIASRIQLFTADYDG